MVTEILPLSVVTLNLRQGYRGKEILNSMEISKEGLEVRTIRMLSFFHTADSVKHHYYKVIISSSSNSAEAFLAILPESFYVEIHLLHHPREECKLFLFKRLQEIVAQQLSQMR